MRGAWRSYLHAVFCFAPKLLSLTVLAALFAALFEGVGIMTLLSPLGLLAAHGSGGNWTRSLQAMTSAKISPLALALLLFVAATGLRSLMIGIREYLMAQLQLSFASSLRRRLFDALCAADWAQIAGRRRSSLLHALSAEVMYAEGGVQSLIIGAATAFLVLVQLCVAMLLSAKITLLVSAAVLLWLYFAGGTLRHSLGTGALIRRARERSIAAAADAFNAIKQIKSQALERVFRDSFSLRQRQLEQTLLSHVRANQRSDARYQLLGAGGLALTLWLAMERWHFEIARTAVLMVIFARLAPLVVSLIRSCRQALLAAPACEHVRAMTKELEDFAVPQAPVTRQLERPWQEIRFEGVGFRYGAAQPWVLRHVDLCIGANTTVVMLGPSGSGKTTLIDLLAGLLRPTVGRILIDGVALQSLDQASWSSGLAYMVQDGMLWDMSVRDNLTFGLSGLDDAELERALQSAGAAEVVAATEHGLDSPVGERGERFSGGERQRLALAQALLRRPRLLLLDEPSSSLDARCVESLRRTLTDLRGRMTIVISTHDTRLASLADQTVDLTEERLLTPLVSVRDEFVAGTRCLDSR